MWISPRSALVWCPSSGDRQVRVVQRQAKPNRWRQPLIGIPRGLRQNRTTASSPDLSHPQSRAELAATRNNCERVALMAPVVVLLIAGAARDESEQRPVEAAARGDGREAGRARLRVCVGMSATVPF